MIDAHALTKRFTLPNGQPLLALGPLELKINQGEFVVIVGPSGCGKSTLLRMIAGLDGQSDGTLQVGDAQPGMVFQGDSTFPWMTVHDNVSYPLRMRGADAAVRDATVRRLLDTVGLSTFAEAYPHQLSGGMKQRVALARAWANDSRLLLMDEPFGALDEQTRVSLQTELLRIWAPGSKTILFVTHSIDEALALGDRVLVMSARPGVIAATFEVPFARPRDPVALRAAPGYGALAVKIWEALK